MTIKHSKTEETLKHCFDSPTAPNIVGGDRRGKKVKLIFETARHKITVVGRVIAIKLKKTKG
jgi:hypothetical protein